METEMHSTGRTIATLLATAVIGLGGLGVGGAVAANSNPQMALSSGMGGTSCGYFMSLGKTGQDHLVSYLVENAPGETLATIPPSTTGGGASAMTSGSSMGTIAPTDRNMGPLRASTLVAACQAATSTSTLRSAYQKFAMGGTASSSQ
jgi:hypothetical protein